MPQFDQHDNPRNRHLDRRQCAFAYCSNLTAVYFKGNLPNNVGPAVFHEPKYCDSILPKWHYRLALECLRKIPHRPLEPPKSKLNEASFGIHNQQVGFPITGTSNDTGRGGSHHEPRQSRLVPPPNQHPHRQPNQFHRPAVDQLSRTVLSAAFAVRCAAWCAT